MEKSKSWFEYLFNGENPQLSTYRCRLCHKYYDEFGLQSNHKPALAEAAGSRRFDKAQNKKRILDHSKTPGHMKIIEILEKKSAKRSILNFILELFLEYLDHMHKIYFGVLYV